METKMLVSIQGDHIWGEVDNICFSTDPKEKITRTRFNLSDKIQYGCLDNESKSRVLSAYHKRMYSFNR